MALIQAAKVKHFFEIFANCAIKFNIIKQKHTYSGCFVSKIHVGKPYYLHLDTYKNTSYKQGVWRKTTRVNLNKYTRVVGQLNTWSQTSWRALLTNITWYVWQTFAYTNAMNYGSLSIQARVSPRRTGEAFFGNVNAACSNPASSFPRRITWFR